MYISFNRSISKNYEKELFCLKIELNASFLWYENKKIYLPNYRFNIYMFQINFDSMFLYRIHISNVIS